MTASASATEQSLARLHEHSDFISRLAHALVRDAASADDLIQETWIAALQAKGPIRSPRAWFATVLRNLARQRHRGESRRQRREREAVDPRSVEAPDEASERFETTRSLANHVARLEEPYRQTVILHYFDDLTLAEIGRRHEVPASTIRWRLRRALELLREQLDESTGGERRVWCLAMIPLAIRRTSRARYLAPLLAATLLVSVGGVVVWGVGRGLGSDPGDGAPSVVAADSSETPTEALPGNAGVDPTNSANDLSDPTLGSAPVAPKENTTAVSPSPTAKTAGIVGRFVDTAGDPIPGVKLSPTSVGAGAFAQMLINGLFPDRRSGDDGTIRLIVSASPRVLAKIASLTGASIESRISLNFEATCEGYRNEILRLVLEDGVERDFGTRTLVRWTRARGRVVDDQNQPVEGAEIFSSFPPFPASDSRSRGNGPGFGATSLGTTAADGTFDVLTQPGFQRVWAKSSDHGYAWEHVEVVEGEDHSLEELVLPKKPKADSGDIRELTVRVVTPEGAPIPDVRVLAKSPLLTSAGSSNEAGEYRVTWRDRPEQADSLSVWASDSSQRWALTHASWEEPTEGSDLTVVMQPIDLVTIEVTGHEPEDASRIRVLWKFAGTTTWGKPENDGSAVFQVERPVTGAELRVELDGYRSESIEVPASADRVSVTLFEREGVRGRVLAFGEPVSGAGVLLLGNEPGVRGLVNGFPTNFEPRWGRFDQLSEESGEFELFPDQPGRYVVLAFADGYASALSAPFEFRPDAQSVPIELSLTEGATVEGRVTAFDPARRIGGTIVAINSFDGRPRTIRVGEDGYFRFDNLRPGGWRLTVREHEVEVGSGSSSLAGDLPVPEPTFVLDDGETRTVDVALDRVRIEGRVSGLADLRGWTWRLRDPVDASIPASGSVGTGGEWTATLPFTGRMALELRAPGGEFGSCTWETEQELEAGVTRWDVTLPLARLNGQVQPGQQTRGGLELVGSFAGGTIRVPVEIDDPGHFTAALAPPAGVALELERRFAQDGVMRRVNLDWVRQPAQ